MNAQRQTSADRIGGPHRQMWQFAPTDASAALHCDLLKELGLPARQLSSWLHGTEDGQNVLRLLTQAKQFFVLAVPGLREMYLAGAVLAGDGVQYESATGCGRTPASALCRLAGEIAEARARPRLASRLGPRADPGDWEIRCSADPDIRWLSVMRMTTRAVEAVRIIGASGAEDLPARSEGMAAAATMAGASLAALLELVERDAAAHWWVGGRQGRRPSASASSSLSELVARHGPDPGRCLIRLLDLTRIPGLPVMAVLSWDKAAEGLALGVACRLCEADAVEAAHREMCQMRFGLAVARWRAKRAEDRLSPVDRRALARAGVSPDCPLLSPVGTASPPEATPPAGPRQAAEALAAQGIAVSVLDLSAPEDPLKTCKAISPELQPFARGITTAALRKTIGESGGGVRHVGEVPLF